MAEHNPYAPSRADLQTAEPIAAALVPVLLLQRWAIGLGLLVPSVLIALIVVASQYDWSSGSFFAMVLGYVLAMGTAPAVIEFLHRQPGWRMVWVLLGCSLVVPALSSFLVMATGIKDGVFMLVGFAVLNAGLLVAGAALGRWLARRKLRAA